MKNYCIEDKYNEINHSDEAKKYYKNADKEILYSFQMALNEMKISETDRSKIIYLFAMACDRHYIKGKKNLLVL